MLCKKLVLNFTKGYDKIPTLLGPQPQLSTHPGKQHSEAKVMDFLTPFPPEEFLYQILYLPKYKLAHLQNLKFSGKSVYVCVCVSHHTLPA